jgi:hypothetical protein
MFRCFLQYLDEHQMKHVNRETSYSVRDVNLAPITEDEEMQAASDNPSRPFDSQQQEDDEVIHLFIDDESCLFYVVTCQG